MAKAHAWDNGTILPTLLYESLSDRNQIRLLDEDFGQVGTLSFIEHWLWQVCRQYDRENRREKPY